MKFEDLRIQLYSDGADLDDFRKMVKLDYVRGFTTNPTLMKKAGVKDYGEFIKAVVPIIGEKSLSLEVISDDFPEMKRQALKLASFGGNIFVKIPVTNTKGESSCSLISHLTNAGIKVNVTAILTLKQVHEVSEALSGGAPAIISVFAGRIADTGIDPVPIMKIAKEIIGNKSNCSLLWASTRELLNVIQAEEAGCDIITVPPSILSKLSKIGYDNDIYSLDTVKMFYSDAVSSEFSI